MDVSEDDAIRDLRVTGDASVTICRLIDRVRAWRYCIRHLRMLQDARNTYKNTQKYMTPTHPHTHTPTHTHTHTTVLSVKHSHTPLEGSFVLSSCLFSPWAITLSVDNTQTAHSNHEQLFFFQHAAPTAGAASAPHSTSYDKDSSSSDDDDDLPPYTSDRVVHRDRALQVTGSQNGGAPRTASNTQPENAKQDDHDESVDGDVIVIMTSDEEDNTASTPLRGKGTFTVHGKQRMHTEICYHYVHSDPTQST